MISRILEHSRMRAMQRLQRVWEYGPSGGERCLDLVGGRRAGVGVQRGVPLSLGG